MQTSTVFATLVGRPNVGKSSLLNRFVGEKVAIVTKKPQTTRTKIMGIVTKEDVQCVFTDTPGMHKPKTKLSEFMIKQVNEGIADVDVVILVTDAANEIHRTELEFIENFKKSKTHAILAINKIDLLLKKDLLLDKIAKFTELFSFDAIVPVSALQGDGIEDLFFEIKKHAQPGPHHFDKDAFTDQSERVLAAEMVREKILINMQDEIPHGIAVMVEKMSERDDKDLLDVEVTIFCEKDSHKGMLIGKNGMMLKRIATSARLDLENFFQIKVNLKCWVKVKDDWRNEERRVTQFLKT